MAKTKAPGHSSFAGTAAPASKQDPARVSKPGAEAGALRPGLAQRLETDSEKGLLNVASSTAEGRADSHVDRSEIQGDKEKPDARSHMPAIIKTANDPGDKSSVERDALQTDTGKDALKEGAKSYDPVQDSQNVDRNYSFVAYPRQGSPSFKVFILEQLASLSQKAQNQARKARKNPKTTLALLLFLLVSWPAIIGLCLVAGAIGLVAAFWIMVIAAILGAFVAGIVISIAWVFVLSLGVMAMVTGIRRAYRCWSTPADAA